MTKQETINRRRNSVVVQGTILGAAAIIVRIIGLLYRIPLTNALGGEGAGYYGAAFQVYTLFLFLSSYGFPTAIAKIVSEKMAFGKYKEAHAIFKASLILSVLLGALSSLIMYMAAPLIAEHILNLKGSSLALRALSPALFFYSLMASLRGYFQGMNSMMPTALSQIAEQVLNAVFSYVLCIIWVKQSVELGAAGGTMGTGIGAAAGFSFMLFVYFISRNRVIHKRMNRDTNDFTKEHISYYWTMVVKIAIPIILGSVVLTVAGVVDTSIFNKALEYQGITNEEEIGHIFGLYAMHVKILIRLPITLAYSFGAASIPAIAKSFAVKEMDQVALKIKTAVKSTMIILIPSAVGLFVLSYEILDLLFQFPDGGIEIASTALKLGAVAVVFNGLFTVTMNIMQGLGLLKKQVLISLGAFGLKVVINFILLYGFKMQINGLILSDNIFTLFLSIMNVMAIHKCVAVDYDIQTSVLRPLISAIVMGLTCYLSAMGVMAITDSNLLSVAVSIVLGGIVYSILLLKLKALTEQEILEFPKGTSLLRWIKKVGLL